MCMNFFLKKCLCSCARLSFRVLARERNQTVWTHLRTTIVMMDTEICVSVSTAALT